MKASRGETMASKLPRDASQAMVKRSSARECRRLLHLDNGECLEVHRFAPVSRGDQILIDRERGHVHVPCENGTARVVPIYRSRCSLCVGQLMIPLVIKEITSEDEYQGYQFLTDFHYRSKKLFGRSAVLVAVTKNELLPRVLGYIELSTPFFMNKARHRLFDAPFEDEQDKVRWTHWDVRTAKKYVNVIVRIARCVVHPEFRGLGLGQILVMHAKRFAKRHWQVKGLKPYFVEITADMLKFVPFVQKAGLKYIGTTEGNLGRVSDDLRYTVENMHRVGKKEILRRGAGAMTELQVKYARSALRILDDENLTAAQLYEHLSSLHSSLSPEEYSLLHSVLRFPKPTYLAGLTRRANAYVQRRLRQLAVQEPLSQMEFTVMPMTGPISLRNITVKFISSVPRTRKTTKVQEAFGIAPDCLEASAIRDFSLEIDPGSIVMITGASGSGKTTLIKLLTGELTSRLGIHVEGTVDFPDEANVASFTALRSDGPLVEMLGGKDLARALYALNMAGLSEAQLYLRRYDELSNGQQYRAAIARLIDSRASVWIGDEFCAGLDYVSANIVAHNLSRHARAAGVTVVVAVADPEPIIDSLQPNVVVHMSAAQNCGIYHGEEFREHLWAAGSHNSRLRSR